jgi:hypothetical protein
MDVEKWELLMLNFESLWMEGQEIMHNLTTRWKYINLWRPLSMGYAFFLFHKIQIAQYERPSLPRKNVFSMQFKLDSNCQEKTSFPRYSKWTLVLFTWNLANIQSTEKNEGFYTSVRAFGGLCFPYLHILLYQNAIFISFRFNILFWYTMSIPLHCHSVPLGREQKIEYKNQNRVKWRASLFEV